MHQKHQKHKNATKQKHKMLHENKNKKCAKKTSKEKKVTYLFICVFCASKEKRIEKREKSPQC